MLRLNSVRSRSLTRSELRNGVREPPPAHPAAHAHKHHDDHDQGTTTFMIRTIIMLLWSAKYGQNYLIVFI